MRGRATWDPRGFCPRRGEVEAVGCVSHCEGTGHHDHLFLRHGRCALLDCRTCAWLKKRKRGVAVYGRIGGAPTAHLVVTLPASWRELLGCDRVLELRDRVHRTLTTWAAEVDEVERGWICHLHPAGDGEQEEGQDDEIDPYRWPDDGQWKPHFHVASPCVGLRDGVLVDLKTWREPSELAALRAIWQSELDDVADLLGVPYEPANVHYRFRVEPAQRIHAIAYDMRPWPDWYDGDLSRRLQTYVSWDLSAPNRRAEGIEDWRATVAGVIEDSEEKPEDEREEPDPRDIVRGERCPCCAGRLVPVVGTDIVGNRLGLFDLRDPAVARLRRLGVPLLSEYAAPPGRAPTIPPPLPGGAGPRLNGPYDAIPY